MESFSRLQALTGLSRSVLQRYVQDFMRETLKHMSPNVNIPQQQLLEAFDRLVPELFATADIDPSLAVAPPAHIQPRLASEHSCKHLACSADNRFCRLCQRNPLKRCSPRSNFAIKQLETQMLKAPCKAAIKVVFTSKTIVAEPGSPSSDSAELEGNGVCLEFSLLNGSMHDSWLQQGHEGMPMDEEMQNRCEVLARTRPPPNEPHRKKPNRASEGQRPLLEGGLMTEHTPELRVRAMLQGNRVSLAEFFVCENSETQMGREMTYKMLVRAISLETNQELAQLVSDSFIVTTMRSRHSVKPGTPLSQDPVEKLEGLGARTKLNLSNVRACVRHIDGRATVPVDAPNKITTVEEFKKLEESLRGWASCSRAIRRALLPEAAVEHSRKVLEADSRVRSWRPDQHSGWGLLYRCSQAQVEFGNPAVVVEPTADAQRSLLVLASQASNEQMVRMRELASMALERWKEAGHPGWAVTEADSSDLLDELERFQGVVSFEGRLAALGHQTPPAAAASCSQDMSDVAQAHSRSYSDPLASITSGMNTGSLEDRPFSSFGGQAALGVGPRASGQFAAPEQDYWQGLDAAPEAELLNFAGIGDQVLLGRPVESTLEAEVLRQERQAGHLPSSTLTGSSISSQPDPLLELLAQQSPRRSLSLQAPSPLTRQLPAQVPQRQEVQWQPQFGLPARVHTSLNSMTLSSGGQVPQLQVFPASQELASASTSLDTTSSRSGGRASRRNSRSSPWSPVQTPAQAQHASQQGQGQGLPGMPSRRATSWSPAAVGPFSRAPNLSPSPEGLAPSGVQACQQAYPPSSAWCPERSSQGGLAGSPQGVLTVPLPIHQPMANPFIQNATCQGWGQSGVPQVLGGRPVSPRATSTGSESALKRHRVSPPQSPDCAPHPNLTPHQRPHSAPTHGMLHPGWPALQQGTPPQPSSDRDTLPSQQHTWPEGHDRGACGASGHTDYPAGPSSPPCQATHPLQDPNLPGSSHRAESRGAGLSDVTSLHAPVVVLDEDQSAMRDSHSGPAGFRTDGFEDFLTQGDWLDMFPATPPPAAEAPPQAHSPNRLSEEGAQHVKQRVLLSSSKAATGGAEAPGCAEEVHRDRAEADRSKGTAMLSALASAGSLNLSQELVLRDCCFKWKQGVRNTRRLANSSTLGSSSQCRGFWRTDSHTPATVT